MEIVKELMQLAGTSTWAVMTGFGMFLAYKLSMTWMISYTVIKTVTKIINAIMDSRDDKE